MTGYYNHCIIFDDSFTTVSYMSELSKHLQNTHQIRSPYIQLQTSYQWNIRKNIFAVYSGKVAQNDSYALFLM